MGRRPESWSVLSSRNVLPPPVKTASASRASRRPASSAVRVGTSTPIAASRSRDLGAVRLPVLEGEGDEDQAADRPQEAVDLGEDVVQIALAVVGRVADQQQPARHRVSPSRRRHRMPESVHALYRIAPEGFWAVASPRRTPRCASSIRTRSRRPRRLGVRPRGLAPRHPAARAGRPGKIVGDRPQLQGARQGAEQPDAGGAGDLPQGRRRR